MKISVRESFTNLIVNGTSSMLVRRTKQGLKRAFLFVNALAIMLMGLIFIPPSSQVDAATKGGLASPSTGVVMQPFLGAYSLETWYQKYYDQFDNQLPANTNGAHSGVDISNGGSDCSYPVYAAASGKVIWASFDPAGKGFGWSVVVENGFNIGGNGKYMFTLYGHMGTVGTSSTASNSCLQVNVGQNVNGASTSQPTLLGYQGSSGESTSATHVHFTIFISPNDYSQTLPDPYVNKWVANAYPANPDPYLCANLTQGDTSATGFLTAGQNACGNTQAPGGWWEGSTPNDGTSLPYGSTVQVSVKGVDNGNGGLDHINVTAKQNGGSWQVLKTKSYGSGVNSDDLSVDFSVPAFDVYISFDVYTKNGSFQLAPQGERHICAGLVGAYCAPATSSSGIYGLMNIGGGSTQDGSCIPGQNQASIFTNPNYGGQCQILNSGYYPNPSYISLPNDSISSVKIGSGAQLELCREDNYSNTCQWFSSDNSDLAYTSIGTDQASSAQVQSPDMPTCTPGVNQASFFVDDHFKGQCVTKDVGIYNDMNAIGTIPNDSVSSVKVGAGIKLEMCQDNNLANTCQLLDSGDFDFGGLAIGNDQMSSAAVISDGSQPNLPSPACTYDTSRSGILLYQGPNYTGSCVFLTSDVNDLTSTQFMGAQSVRILGTYLNYYQAIGYSDTNFSTTCGTFTVDTADLGTCDGAMRSIRVTTYIPAQLANNIVSYAQRDEPSSGAAVDNDLTTEWVGGHQVPLSFVYSSPQMMQEIVVFDRAQSSTDNNQENSIQLTFSDGTQIKYINMQSGGPRCADVRFPAKAASWVVVEPYDASGNNGFREVQIWDNSGTVHSSITCPNIVNGSFVPMSDGKLPQFQNIAPTVPDQWFSTQEKQTGQITINATQPGGLPLTLTATNLPSFATFSDNGNGTATISATPQVGQAGSYDIPVTANNGTTTGMGTVHVTITPAPIAPTAALSATPTSGTAPVTVTADASASVQGTNAVASYSFDFGDGTVVGPQVNATASHTYTTAGTYTLQVTVTDSIGLTDTRTQAITVAPTPKTATLTEDWSLGTIDSAIWNNWGGSNVAVVNQQLHINSTAAPNYFGITTAIRYDLTGSSITNKLISAGNQKIASFEAYPVNVGPDSNNQLSWYVSGGNIIAKKKINNVQTIVRTASYSATKQKYFRLRESGGTVYWDYSSDGTTWINFTTLTDPFSLNAVYVDQMVGTWQTESKTTTATFDNFNIAP